MNKFYTYCLIDPRTCQPFYVGKGTGTRMYSHWANRRTKRVTNFRLKHILCELDNQKLKPVYAVVLSNVTSDDAFSKECELISHYGRLDNNTGILCNMTSGGDGRVGWSAEQKTRKADHELSKNKGRPVVQYTLFGEYVATYTSAKRASETVVGANRSYITECCKNGRRSAGGFMWAYDTDPTPVYQHTDHSRIRQLTLSGEEICVFLTMTEAANSVNRTPQAISSCCRGKTKKCAGYRWEYVE